MKPPFLGTKVVADIDLKEVYRLIDTRSLFQGRWQFKRCGKSEEAYQEILKLKAWPPFEGWKRRCIDEKILEPKVVYGYFERVTISLPCLPAGRSPNLPISPTIPLQLVTVGSKVVDKCQWLFAAHQYTDYLYLHGLAAATAEALAEYWHKKILRELGVAFNVGKKLPTGSRISPGYPIWPDLSDQKKICELLHSESIGVTLLETYQLVPEYSTSAMIVI